MCDRDNRAVFEHDGAMWKIVWFHVYRRNTVYDMGMHIEELGLEDRAGVA